MKTIRLKWLREILLREIPLRRDTGENLMYSADWSKLPEASGVYVFGRRYGKDFEALYVGKATRLRSRVQHQCERVPLMMHLKKAKSGKRVILVARFVPMRGGQSAAKCIDIAERALIRHFMLEGHNLANKQNMRVRRHEIHSTGGKVRSANAVPAIMFLEQR